MTNTIKQRGVLNEFNARNRARKLSRKPVIRRVSDAWLSVALHIRRNELRYLALVIVAIVAFGFWLAYEHNERMFP